MSVFYIRDGVIHNCNNLSNDTITTYQVELTINHRVCGGMDTNVIVAISVSISAVCLCCMCILGERFARARREKDREEFCAAAAPVDKAVLVHST